MSQENKASDADRPSDWTAAYTLLRDIGRSHPSHTEIRKVMDSLATARREATEAAAEQVRRLREACEEALAFIKYGHCRDDENPYHIMNRIRAALASLIAKSVDPAPEPATVAPAAVPETEGRGNHMTTEEARLHALFFKLSPEDAADIQWVLGQLDIARAERDEARAEAERLRAENAALITHWPERKGHDIVAQLICLAGSEWWVDGMLSGMDGYATRRDAVLVASGQWKVVHGQSDSAAVRAAAGVGQSGEGATIAALVDGEPCATTKEAVTKIVEKLRDDWTHAPEMTCPKRACGVKGQIYWIEINSDHGDEQYRCRACQHTWVAEGADA